MLLQPLLDKYFWERYECPYPPSYLLNRITTVLQQGRLWHEIIHKGCYAIKQKKKKKKQAKPTDIHKVLLFGGARGVMVIVTGIGHGDTSSNPGREWLHFT